MNRLLITILCLLTLAGCGDKPFPPLSGDARHRVQQQLDRCLVQVKESRLSWYEGWPHYGNQEESAIVIAADGTAMVSGGWGYPLYNGTDEFDKPYRELWKKLKVKLANGRWVAYKQVAVLGNGLITILKPLKPLKNQPYMDISKIRRAPMGLPVYIRVAGRYSKSATIESAVVTNDAQLPSPEISTPLSLAFSTLTGEFLGFHFETYFGNTRIRQLSKHQQQFISQNTGIKFSEGGVVRDHLDVQYSRAYTPLRNSMCQVQFKFEGNPKHHVSTAYVMTPSGDMLTDLPLELSEEKPKINKMPAIATLPDGQTTKLKWMAMDKDKKMLILRPLTPLKRPLTPVVWALGSKPQIGRRYFACSYGVATADEIVGFDRVYPERFVLRPWPPFILFDDQGQAVGLTIESWGVFAGQTTSTAESVKYVQSLVPDQKISTANVNQQNTVAPIMTALSQGFRIWGWESGTNIKVGIPLGWNSTAICIDDSGYFVLPMKSYHMVESRSGDILKAYNIRDDMDYIRDESGTVGQAAVVYHNPKLGISISKMLKPPTRPMKAVSLAHCPEAPSSEQLWNVDVALYDGRLIPYRKPYKPASRTVRPERGDDGVDTCYLVVSSDGTLRGYGSVVRSMLNHQKSVLVDMAEIGKKLAYVKKALGE
ncbi:MAG: hypothetical protein ACYC1M_18620 [Armatimonadota bacterium]